MRKGALWGPRSGSLLRTSETSARRVSSVNLSTEFHVSLSDLRLSALTSTAKRTNAEDLRMVVAVPISALLTLVYAFCVRSSW